MTQAEIRAKAITLLSRREYARRELAERLGRYGFGTAAVQQVIAELVAEGLQSDDRYAESLIRSAVDRGQGLTRIRARLRECGVDDAVIADHLGEAEVNWQSQAEQVRHKRFGPELPTEPKERARQARFLQYRGFNAEQIRKALKQNDWD